MPCYSIQQQHIIAKPPSITIFSILLASERVIVGGGQEQGYTLCHILFLYFPRSCNKYIYYTYIYYSKIYIQSEGWWFGLLYYTLHRIAKKQYIYI